MPKARQNILNDAPEHVFNSSTVENYYMKSASY